MRVSLRLAVSALMVILSSIAFAITPQAFIGPGPGPGNLPAGTYHTTTLRANFNFGTYPDPSGSIYVTATTQESNPEGGPSTTTSETDVNINLFSPTYSSACFALANPSDFRVSSGLAGATLNTIITGANPACAGYPGPPYFQGPPLTLVVTWTGTGPIATARNSSNFTCGSYKAESTSANTTNVGSVSASLTLLLPNPLTAQGGFGSTDEQIHAEGVSLDGCTPLFGSKGAGFGPQPAGSYRFANLQAGAFFQLTSGGQVGFNVANFTNTMRPEGGPATVTHEIDLFVSVFSSSGFGFTCVVIPASDFTSIGIQSAHLHTTVDTTSTPCAQPPGFGSIPTMTVDVTWSNVGPVSTVRDESTYSCDTFSQHGQGTTSSNVVNVAATITPALTDTFASSQGSLSTFDLRTEIKGVQSMACLVRG